MDTMGDDFGLTRRELRGLNTFFKFDDRISGPWNGFRGAEDYYAKTRSDVLLKHVAVPTLILNANNDPLVPAQPDPTAARRLRQSDFGDHRRRRASRFCFRPLALVAAVLARHANPRFLLALFRLDQQPRIWRTKIWSAVIHYRFPSPRSGFSNLDCGNLLPLSLRREAAFPLIFDLEGPILEIGNELNYVALRIQKGRSAAGKSGNKLPHSEFRKAAPRQGKAVINYRTPNLEKSLRGRVPSLAKTGEFRQT